MVQFIVYSIGLWIVGIGAAPLLGLVTFFLLLYVVPRFSLIYEERGTRGSGTSVALPNTLLHSVAPLDGRMYHVPAR